LNGNRTGIDGKVAGCGWLNEDGYGGAFEGVWMVGRWGREYCWLGCEQKEMVGDKYQNFPTVILSFSMGESEITVAIFDYSFQSVNAF
jgi:hypothetical protein